VINVGRKYHFKIGQRRSLSPIDKAQLRDMYQCNKKVSMEKKRKFLTASLFLISGAHIRQKKKQLETQLLYR